MIYRAIIADDEPLARERVAELLLKHKDSVEVVAEAVDGQDTLEKITRHAPDLVFLDIEMPGLNAFEILAQLDRQPRIIFTTAFDRYAVKAFKTNSIEYLLKPIDQQNMDRAIAKLKHLSPPNAEVIDVLRNLENRLAKRYLTRMTARIGDVIHLIDMDQVLYLQSGDKYTNICTPTGQYPVETPLVVLEPKLNPRRFKRIHRNAIVNLSYVAKIRKDYDGGFEVTMRNKDNTKLRGSRKYASGLSDPEL